MRTLVIGDIHGYSATLDALSAAVAVRPDDLIITLGDYVDRGPDSRGVLDRLIALHRTGRLIPIYGNHDQMMVDALVNGTNDRMWLFFGGEETLASYGPPDDEGRIQVPEAHLDFLQRQCREYHETDTHIFAHATVNPLLPMKEQNTDDLRWMKLDGPIEHYSGKTLICGHTRQAAGLPWVLPGTICIDTGVYDADGWLTCLHVETGDYWQANNRGETRTGNISALALKR